MQVNSQNDPLASQRWISFLASIRNSQLSRQLLLGFFAVALIEFGFLSILGFDVLKAEKLASREFVLLDGARSISRIIKSAGLCIDAAKDSIKEPDDQKRYNDFRQRAAQTLGSMDQLCASLENQKIDAGGLKTMRASFAELDHAAQEVHAEVKVTGGGKDALGSGSKLMKHALSLYRAYLKQIQRTKEALASSQENTAFLGIDPSEVLKFAACANLFLLIAMGTLLRQSISSPLRRLSQGCLEILQGKVLSPPAQTKNEIDLLEMSFHQMSLVIMENEKRRHSFLEFFQSVQKASLEKVRTCFEALLTENSLSERARKSIEKARTNLATLIQLLQSMTEALSFDSNKNIQPKYLECTSSQLINTATAAVEGLLTKREISLKIESSNETACRVDATLINRVLVNFLSNAIKYSPAGAEVALCCLSDGTNLQFRISDRGPGISVEGKEKLFKEFSMVEAADGVKRSGSGLGLLICKQIVEAHSGQVGVESQVGAGSCFWFELPAFPVETAKTKGKRKLSESAKRRKAGSINHTFIVMLLLFLLPQSLLLHKLNLLFAGSSASARRFAVDKEIFLRSEEILGLFLSWKIKVMEAVETESLDGISAANDLLNEQISHCLWILKHLPESNPSHLEARRMISGLNKLRKFGAYIERRKDELSVVSIVPLVKQARNIGKEIEEAGFSLRDNQDEQMDRSYSGSQSTSSELFATLAAAAIVNLAVLGFLSLMGLRITRKISELKIKSEEFASGKRLEPTLKGNDELSLLDENLCRLSSTIKDADEQRQKLIAVINHDLRTPLTAIINALELILASGYGEIGPKEKSLTESAEDELNRLLQQINDLLLIEKIDAGLYQLSTQKFEILPVLSRTLKSFDQDASRRGIKLVPSMERSQGRLCIEGDPALIEREFSILLANAINAAPPGSKIDCSVKRDGDQLAVSVSDQGPGIDSQLLPQIFERFRFLDGKPVPGLGLPLAQRLCQVHGGSIAIDSSSSGTRTMVRLPLAKQ